MTDRAKKMEELHDLIDDMQIAMLTTRRADGRLVSRPMATQEAEADADLWFVANIESDKMDDLEANPEVNVAYYDSETTEWVSVSGRGRISKDRARIRELWAPDWRIWFEKKSEEMDGGPDDPRLALIFVEAESVRYMKKTASKPVVLFEMAKAAVTGDAPDVAREETVEGM
jgi:general stress protein 26